MKIDSILSSLSKLYAKGEAINKQIADLQKKLTAETKAAKAEPKAKAAPRIKKAVAPKKT